MFGCILERQSKVFWHKREPSRVHIRNSLWRAVFIEKRDKLSSLVNANLAIKLNNNCSSWCGCKLLVMKGDFEFCGAWVVVWSQWGVWEQKWTKKKYFLAILKFPKLKKKSFCSNGSVQEIFIRIELMKIPNHHPSLPTTPRRQLFMCLPLKKIQSKGVAYGIEFKSLFFGQLHSFADLLPWKAMLARILRALPWKLWCLARWKIATAIRVGCVVSLNRQWRKRLGKTDELKIVLINSVSLHIKFH